VDKRRTFTVDEYIVLYNDHLENLAQERGISFRAVKELFRHFMKIFVFSCLSTRTELEFPRHSGTFYKRVGISRFQVRIDRERSRKWLAERDNF
jgi:hypothetical protein